MTRFSIIIPAFNSANHITKALNSVKNQTFKDYELIVICDRCVDKTEQIARKYTTKVEKVNFGNDGRSRSRGLDIATGEYVLFMDDDDWFLHEFVLEMLDAKLKRFKPAIDVLCFSFIYKGKGYAEPISHINGNERWIAVWSKCWRRQAIGRTRFPDVRMCSDRYFHEAMMKKPISITEWDMPLYYYNFMRVGSQTEISKRKPKVIRRTSA